MERGTLSEIFVSFQGEGQCVGRRQLFLRMAGCNLRCRYCDTPASLVKTPQYQVRCGPDERRFDNPASVAEVVAHLELLSREQGPIDGLAITGGEPLLQANFLAELLARPGLPRPRLLETSGILVEQLIEVLPHLDVVSMDLKIPSNTGEGEFWGQHERFLAVARGKAYVKILIDDGTAAAEIGRAAEMVGEVAPETPVFLQPITAESGRPQVSERLLFDSYRRARERLAEVRILPQTHKFLGIP